MDLIHSSQVLLLAPAPPPPFVPLTPDVVIPLQWWWSWWFEIHTRMSWCDFDEVWFKRAARLLLCISIRMLVEYMEHHIYNITHFAPYSVHSWRDNVDVVEAIKFITCRLPVPATSHFYRIAEVRDVCIWFFVCAYFGCILACGCPANPNGMLQAVV